MACRWRRVDAVAHGHVRPGDAREHGNALPVRARLPLRQQQGRTRSGARADAYRDGIARRSKDRRRPAPSADMALHPGDRLGHYEVISALGSGAMGDGAQRWSVSANGGLSPVWAPDGRRLYYRLPGSRGNRGDMWVVDVSASPSFSAGKPRRLFAAPRLLSQFDIAPNGRRFAMVQEDDTPPPRELRIVLNCLRATPSSRGR